MTCCFIIAEEERLCQEPSWYHCGLCKEHCQEFKHPMDQVAVERYEIATMLLEQAFEITTNCRIDTNTERVLRCAAGAIRVRG